ncbi:MAG: strawberry notch C-terminal domain-containing protein [Bacteroidetes bacterium]|nr:strawberry notch C-terminal domain-containing protein [Bacteroidota bacterium]
MDTRLLSLQNDFRELARGYYTARTSGHIALSTWPALDRSFKNLGRSLTLDDAEIDALLSGRQVTAQTAGSVPAVLSGLGADGRLLHLRKLFTEIVALYAMALCAGRIDTRMEPVIDAKFESIATQVGQDFHDMKALELRTCAPQPARPETTPTAATEAEMPSGQTGNAAATDERSEETEQSTEQQSIIVGRARIEGRLDSGDFKRFAMPWVLEHIATTNERTWQDVKTRLEALEKKPDAFNGTQKDYLESVARERMAMRELRDGSYRLFTATRNRTTLDTDADPSVYMAVNAEVDRLYKETGGVLTPEMRQAALQAFDAEMRSSRFYEHFPTPQHVIDSMLQYAQPKAGDRVLEPSAGEGNIASSIAAIEGVRLEVVEYEPLLSDILSLKGFDVVGSDFMAYNTNGEVKYDAIIMNPPFDRGVDIQHVYHAFSMLKPGGRLVAITSGASIDGIDESNYAFRDFITERGSWKMYSPKEYMGPSGKLTNGRSIGIVTAMVTVTRKAEDTFGRRAVGMEPSEVAAGAFVFDTQGSQSYEIIAFEEDAATGKVTTKVRNVISGATRTFNGHLKSGSRFVAVKDESEARALAAVSAGDVGTDGRIVLPKLPPPPKEGATDLKPLRIVTSRGELMPPPPSQNLFDEKIAANVTLTPGQIEGINRAIEAMYGPTRAFLLADGTGFGKTLQILMVAATIAKKDKQPVLIFTKSPSIIETSFYDDARKLKIDTPDAQNMSDRKVFKGAGASGLAIHRVKNIEDLLKRELGSDVYIASYHAFGRWSGDKAERKEVEVWKKMRVDPFKAEMQKKRQSLERELRYMSQESAEAVRQKLRDDEDTNPVMVRYRELLDKVRAVNEAMFGSVGKRFAAILSDEAHAFKNYNPDDFNDGSAQAFRGMVLYGAAKRGLFATATPADKVDHLRYLKGLNVYKTEAQYMRLMERLGFRYSEPEYSGGTLVKRGKFTFDSALPPEYVLNNISRLFENLTMAGTMVKRELSLDNFEAHNIMIGGAGSPPAEQIAVMQAMNQLAIIDNELKDKKRCKASIINEKKWALEPFKIQKTIEIVRKELLEGRQVIIYCSLVNDSGPSFKADLECSAVDKPSTVNTLSRELGALFGEDKIGFVTGVRSSDAETLGDDAAVPKCSNCDDADHAALWEPETAVQQAHEDAFFTLGDSTVVAGLSDAANGLADATQNKRADDIRAFQSGEKRILIATAEAGGTGISLDDTVGNAPRTIIIMTSPFSSVEAVQILGRINRAKTKSRQRAYFLWVNLPVDRRLRDIIAAKLRVLGAAVQGEVKKVSVEEAEFASAENAQENYDKHNVDREGKVKEHSLTDLQVIDGEKLPSRIPFTLTHKTTISNEIEPVSQMRHRWRPIRFKSNLKSGARTALKDWMSANAALVKEYRMELLSDRYQGSYLEAQFNAELWQYMLNFLKPENTRFTLGQAQRFREGERVVAATDIIEAGAKVGDPGTITRVWVRRVRALDKQTGKTIVDESGQLVFNEIYDYMVDFDSGERANNLEAWEIMSAARPTDDDEDVVQESTPELSDNHMKLNEPHSSNGNGDDDTFLNERYNSRAVEMVTSTSDRNPVAMTVNTPTDKRRDGRASTASSSRALSLQDKIDEVERRVRTRMSGEN